MKGSNVCITTSSATQYLSNQSVFQTSRVKSFTSRLPAIPFWTGAEIAGKVVLVLFVSITCTQSPIFQSDDRVEKEINQPINRRLLLRLLQLPQFFGGKRVFFFIFTLLYMSSNSI